MKVIQVNCTILTGSTGRIVYDLGEVIKSQGYECAFLCGYKNKQYNGNNIKYTEFLPADIADKKNMFLSRLTGTMGYRNIISTVNAMHWIKKQKPDVVHLHNIHGDWICLQVLFN